MSGARGVGDLRKEPARWRSLLCALDLGLVLYMNAFHTSRVWLGRGRVRRLGLSYTNHGETGECGTCVWVAVVLQGGEGEVVGLVQGLGGWSGLEILKMNID